jgi:nitrite reductase (NO-forming)
MNARAAWKLIAVLLAAVVASVVTTFAFRGTGAENPTDTMVFGLPEAEVFTEDYAGAPYVGDAVTLAPDVAPLAAGNRTHDVRIDVIEAEIEIAPGVRYHAWTFGGVVPGPILHVRQGDRVNFVMKNRSGEAAAVTEPGKPAPMVYPMPHSIDFHAATVAPNDKWRVIQAGESIKFQWVANYPGVYTYHCGGAPVLQHVAMGQYGIVIVSPKDGFPTDAQVNRNYAVIQSEFYLKPDEADENLWAFDMDAARRKEPSHVLFNGQAATPDNALIANAGERVRFYLHNVGPNDHTSFHVIGTIFDRVFFEGNPRNELFGMQTVALGASNGAVLEFIVPEEGEYVFVDHEFADALKGALGRIRARASNGQVTKAPGAPMKH